MAEKTDPFAALRRAFGMPTTASNADVLAKLDEATARHRDLLVDEAVRAGRIVSSERYPWRARLDKEGIAAERLLARLEPMPEHAKAARPARDPDLGRVIDHALRRTAASGRKAATT